MLQELRARRAADQDEQRQRQQAAAELRRKLGQQGLDGLQREALERERNFEERKRAALVAGGPGAGGGDADGSRRAYYKEFVRVVQASDVVVQVLDARDPLGCRCTDIERFVLRTNPSKKVVLLLNKIDLVPKEVVERWLKYFRQELPAVAFKCATQKQAGHPGARRGKGRGEAGGGGGGAGGDVLGAETLVQLLKNYSRNLNLKTAITVGIVGLPNVGKSSVINSLKRTKAVATGQTPGLTKAAQEVQLDRRVKLLDSPGVVFTAEDGTAANALRNAIKIERLEDPETPVREIVRKCPMRQLCQVYRIPAFASADEFVRSVALARGKLRKGGVADAAAACRLVLQDWNTGAIPFYTEPPPRAHAEHEAAEVVAGWGAAFDADAVFRHEATAVIAGLPGLDAGGVEWARVEAGGGAGALAVAAEEEEDGGQALEAMEAEAPDGAGAEAGAMDYEEGYGGGGGAAGADGGRGTRQQNSVLYAEANIYNPRKAKAARKKAKKKLAEAEAYDFAAVEWGDAGGGAAGAEGDEEDDEEESSSSSEMEESSD